jgi:hemoglobin-like flavoprotein
MGWNKSEETRRNMEVVRLKMQREEINSVKESFLLIKNVNSFSESFYKNLFIYDPSLEKLFKKDINKQTQMLAQALEFAVNKLDCFAEIEIFLRELGKQHKSYGVLPEHYDVVGKILIQTLEEQLGDSISEQTKRSWISAYKKISSTMINC